MEIASLKNLANWQLEKRNKRKKTDVFFYKKKLKEKINTFKDLWILYKKKNTISDFLVGTQTNPIWRNWINR